jgi:hypothetical protein
MNRMPCPVQPTALTSGQASLAPKSCPLSSPCPALLPGRGWTTRKKARLSAVSPSNPHHTVEGGPQDLLSRTLPHRPSQLPVPALFADTRKEGRAWPPNNIAPSTLLAHCVYYQHGQLAFFCYVSGGMHYTTPVCHAHEGIYPVGLLHPHGFPPTSLDRTRHNVPAVRATRAIRETFRAPVIWAEAILSWGGVICSCQLTVAIRHRGSVYCS